jgi:hypothetical protein
MDRYLGDYIRQALPYQAPFVGDEQVGDLILVSGTGQVGGDGVRGGSCGLTDVSDRCGPHSLGG